MNKKIKHYLLASILLTLIVLAYFFPNEEKIQYEIAETHATLEKDPLEGSHGGEFDYKYVRLEIDEDTYLYYLSGCAYIQMDKRILELKKGDHIILGTLFNNSHKKEILSFTSDKYGVLLYLKDYEKCKNRKRNGILIFSLLISLSILFYLIKAK